MKLIAIILTAFPLLAQLPEFGSSPGGGGGSGTVEAVTATCGLNTADGAAITISGSIKGSRIVNAQTGTSYAIQNSDCGKLLTISNGAAIALSIAQAGTGGFDAGWYLTIQNLGAGAATITPATSTINGAATLVVGSGRSVEIYSDGANYQATGSGDVGGAPALLDQYRLVINTATDGQVTQAAAITPAFLLKSDANGVPTHTAIAEANVPLLSLANVFTANQQITLAQNSATDWKTVNTAGGTAASAGFIAYNASNAEIVMRAFGVNFTTAGAFKQDGGILYTRNLLSGGLSIGAEAGDMRFYNGGTADANLMGGLFGSSWCLGPENAACSGTLEVQSGVPTTGNTVITFALGAGDALTSNIFTVAGKMTASGGIVLPANCTGLSAGVLYNNAGTPAICP